MTCPRLDLAQGCSSARLARKSGLPREPQGKGPAPSPAHFSAPPSLPRPSTGEEYPAPRALRRLPSPGCPATVASAHPPLQAHVFPQAATRGSGEPGAGGLVGCHAAARQGRGGEVFPGGGGSGGGEAALPGLPGSPGLLTGGFWENRSSLDFPKTSDKCPHPSSPQEPEQQPPTVGEGTGEGG